MITVSRFYPLLVSLTPSAWYCHSRVEPYLLPITGPCSVKRKGRQANYTCLPEFAILSADVTRARCVSDLAPVEDQLSSASQCRLGGHHVRRRRHENRTGFWRKRFCTCSSLSFPHNVENHGRRMMCTVQNSCGLFVLTFDAENFKPCLKVEVCILPVYYSQSFFRHQLTDSSHASTRFPFLQTSAWTTPFCVGSFSVVWWEMPLGSKPGR